MNLKQGLTIADRIVLESLGRKLNSVELAILKGSWNGQTYEEVAGKNGYSANYLKRDVGPKLWKILENALGEPVSKSNWKAALERIYQDTSVTEDEEQSNIEFDNCDEQRKDIAVAAKQEDLLTRGLLPLPQDWGEAPDVSVFYGRTKELTTLEQWIVRDRTRLIALLGMGGVGKTTLAVKVGQRVQSEFDYVIWRSLRNAPSLQALLNDIAGFLCQEEEAEIEMSQFINYLRSHRCLLILDGLETILNSQKVGYFHQDYEDYNELVRLFGETAHNSCLILTGREKPMGITPHEGENEPVRSIKLKGCPETAVALVENKGLLTTEAQLNRLCSCYSNNPLVLKVITNTIHELFGGDIEEFLQHQTLIFNSIRSLLDEQFKRLSPIEQKLITWLANNRERNTISDLEKGMESIVEGSQLLETIENLSRRSLLEQECATYKLQAILIKYLTNREETSKSTLLENNHNTVTQNWVVVCDK